MMTTLASRAGSVGCGWEASLISCNLGWTAVPPPVLFRLPRFFDREREDEALGADRVDALVPPSSEVDRTASSEARSWTVSRRLFRASGLTGEGVLRGRPARSSRASLAAIVAAEVGRSGAMSGDRSGEAMTTEGICASTCCKGGEAGRSGSSLEVDDGDEGMTSEGGWGDVDEADRDLARYVAVDALESCASMRTPRRRAFERSEGRGDAKGERAPGQRAEGRH
jgi:hypothetical protein